MAWNKYAEDFDSCVKSIYTILFLEDTKFNRETAKFMVGGVADIKKEYLMSEDAYSIIINNKPELLISETLTRYSKDLGLIIEHMIPNSLVVKYLYDHKEEFRNLEKLKGFLRSLTCALISKTEDKKLNEAGLRQALPNNCNINDLVARYKSVGIKLKNYTV